METLHGVGPIEFLNPPGLAIAMWSLWLGLLILNQFLLTWYFGRSRPEPVEEIWFREGHVPFRRGDEPASQTPVRVV